MKKFLMLLFLSYLFLVLVGCSVSSDQDLTQKQELTKKLEEPPQSLKSFSKCIEYQNEMWPILKKANAEIGLPFELRSYHDALIDPILEEATKTSIYELNSLYPELGTAFYTKFICALKMYKKTIRINISSAEYIVDNPDHLRDTSLTGVLLMIASALTSNNQLGEAINELNGNADTLIKKWEDWLDKNIDSINQTISSKYDFKSLKQISKSKKI